MNSANYKEMMAELRAEYLASFDEKFNMMRGFLESLDWYSLELEFHKLKGTGATYGVPEVSELCEQMETLCRVRGELPEKALNQAIELLTSIRKKYSDGDDFELSKSPIYEELKKL